LVIASLKGDDVILCQITSTRADEYAIRLDDVDFVSGGLNQSSRIRPNRLFTADVRIVVYRAGRVSVAKLNEVDRLIAIISQT